MIPLGRTRLRPVRRLGLLVSAAAVVVAGCGAISNSAPVPTAGPFPTIAGQLSQHGIRVTAIASGDAGCPDTNLAKTAIGFDAVGLDQATPVRLHIYIFKNRATYERVRSTVDQCAATFVTDPATYESVESSPYVVAGQGPWGPAFRDNIRAAITEAAGTGD
jgi:hypothetical protein